jgi:hypothetical protein
MPNLGSWCSESGKPTGATAQLWNYCFASWVDYPGGTPSCYFTVWVGHLGPRPGKLTGVPTQLWHFFHGGDNPRGDLELSYSLPRLTALGGWVWDISGLGMGFIIKV